MKKETASVIPAPVVPSPTNPQLDSAARKALAAILAMPVLNNQHTILRAIELTVALTHGKCMGEHRCEK